LLVPGQFTQKKADGEVRWAVLNVVSLLRRHEKTHLALSSAMGRGDSIGNCIRVIELNLREHTPDDI
jgi:hypothetical protein